MLGSTVENASSPMVLTLLMMVERSGVRTDVPRLGVSGAALTHTTPTIMDSITRTVAVDIILRPVSCLRFIIFFLHRSTAGVEIYGMFRRAIFSKDDIFKFRYCQFSILLAFDIQSHNPQLLYLLQFFLTARRPVFRALRQLIQQDPDLRHGSLELL